MTEHADPLEERLRRYVGTAQWVPLSRDLAASTLADLRRRRQAQRRTSLLRAASMLATAAVAGGLIAVTLEGHLHRNAGSSPPGAAVTPSLSASASARPTAVSSPTPLGSPGSGPPLFTENWSGDTVGSRPDDGWVVEQGSATVAVVSDVKVVHTGAGATALSNGSNSWTSVQLRVQVRLDAAASMAEVALRYRDPLNHDSCTLGAGRLVLSRVVGGVRTELAAIAVSEPPGQAVDLGIAASGAMLQCGIGGGASVTATDATLSSGRIAILSSGSIDVGQVAVR